MVSLTTTPMMCAKLLRPEAIEQARTASTARANEFSSGCCAGIRAALELGAAPSRAHADGDALATSASACISTSIVPKGFFPQQDTGRLIGIIQGAQDISFQAMRAKLTQFVDIVKDDPAVDNRGRLHRRHGAAAPTRHGCSSR